MLSGILHYLVDPERGKVMLLEVAAKHIPHPPGRTVICHDVWPRVARIKDVRIDTGARFGHP